MSTHTDPPQTTLGPIPFVPPLEPGDTLSRPEFERRYAAMPSLKKAELVDGVVFVGSAVAQPHASVHGRVMSWLGSYRAHTPGLCLADNATVRLDLQNEVQPDALLRLVAGGRSRVDQDKYIDGAPELIVEVASTSASRDLHSKFALYQRHRVAEYVVVRVLDSELDWFRMETGRFQPLAHDDRGVFRSLVFPGLWLDVAALLRDDMAAVLAELSRGLASPEHHEFVARLSTARDHG